MDINILINDTAYVTERLLLLGLCFAIIGIIMGLGVKFFNKSIEKEDLEDFFLSVIIIILSACMIPISFYLIILKESVVDMTAQRENIVLNDMKGIYITSKNDESTIKSD
ncbi:hypothetical protein PT160_07845 [Erysipelothrix rhusiopathiae]|nr:hypothetical protein [Erysipelothrix rhusiopathiae]MDE8269077.1 hypothetical protein [Erysipelothrix rhusiopathiae]MDE8270654.1 hypothetical protein [Erysipelothrix rhusiopathiae]MDE8279079.1 hypothetical protein [Erysipelothrix rhusiopathiae]MDE8319435.1 hypothetical protein [Erysipelothrix rhusiopathiae]